MTNPLTIALWLNVNCLYQTLRFSKNMLDVFFPLPDAAGGGTTRLATLPVIAGRGRCLGPADLAS